LLLGEASGGRSKQGVDVECRAAKLALARFLLTLAGVGDILRGLFWIGKSLSV
jgi:hypothetical protein